MRSVFAALLALALLVLSALPSLAGELVEGDGYSVRLPDGFSEAASVEDAGRMHIRSSCGSLPVSGVAEMRAYTRGDSVITLARLDLSRTIENEQRESVAQQQLEQVKEQLPRGCDARLRTISGFNAVELTMVHETYAATLNQNILSVVAGDYCVVMVLQTADADPVQATGEWSSMVSTLKIEKGVSKLLLLGLIGGGGLIGLYLLSRVRMQKARDEPEYTGRFKSPEVGQTGPGLAARERPQIGRRPKVLRSATPKAGEPVGVSVGEARPPVPGAGQPARPFTPPTPHVAPRGVGPAASVPGHFAADGATAPVREATSPAVTRPAPQPAAPRPGLRSTLPGNGRWGQ